MILDILGIGAKLIDKLIPDPQAKAAAKLQLLELQQSGALAELTASSNIIQAEANSEHWVTATWRPITALVFVALIAAHWLGFTAPNLGEPERLALMDIVKVMIGGYVVSRGAEKGIKEWKK
jgi:hypothetical protein